MSMEMKSVVSSNEAAAATETAIAVVDRRIDGKEAPTINARDLHTGLEIRRDFTSWIKYQIRRLRLVEGTDYLLTRVGEQVPSGEKWRSEYFLTLAMGKHIAMMSGTDRGFEVRTYFLECEKRYKTAALPSVPETLANPAALRAVLLGYTDRVLGLETVVNTLQPKADFHDAVADGTNCHSLQAAAKVLGLGPNRLFTFLREQRILTAENLPFQKQIEAGRFRVIEGHYKDGRGERHNYTRTLVTGKGLAFIRGLAESRNQPATRSPGSSKPGGGA